MAGMMNEMMENSINHYFSHIQIHNPGFKGNNEIQYTIKDPQKVEAGIKSIQGVNAVTLRTVVFGMATSPTSATGVKAVGIDPAKENEVTQFSQFVKQGSYFTDNKRNEVLVGKKLAEKLHIKLRSKIILTFAAQDGNILSGAFRVCGIYGSGNTQIDAANIFANIQDMNVLLGKDSGYHEIALTLKDVKNIDIVGSDLQKKFPGLKVETWKELSPETATLNDYVGFVLWILMSVMMIGLAFAIVNTMLMAVMERTRELGMLMAIGMNKRRTFLMIMIETISLTFVGCPFGVGIAYLTTEYFGKKGISLASWGKGMENFGMSTMVYPHLENNLYFQVSILVFITAFLSAIYPSIRAIRLKPAEAIRKI